MEDKRASLVDYYNFIHDVDGELDSYDDIQLSPRGLKVTIEQEISIDYGEEGKSIEFDKCTRCKTYTSNGEKIVYNYYTMPVCAQGIDRNVEILHGPYFKWTDTGKPLLGAIYDRGQLHGDFIEMFRNEEHSPYVQGTFKNGKLDGLYRSYHKNTTLHFSQHYRYGELDGSYKEYSDTGVLLLDCNFKGGKLDGNYEMYYESGILQKKCNYILGELDGVSIEFHQNGNIDLFSTYKYGKYHGSVIAFYRSGLARSSCEYHNGILHGNYEEFYNEIDKRTKLQPMRLQQIYVYGKLSGLAIHYAKPYKINGDVMIQDPVSINLHCDGNVTELTIDEFASPVDRKTKMPLLYYESLQTDDGIHGFIRKYKEHSIMKNIAKWLKLK
tara:strand:+ start:16004 stop:17152 length:1149 start_codon:yes stop_codon:yes gene_type:complete